jgi:hypothetical protein
MLFILYSKRGTLSAGLEQQSENIENTDMLEVRHWQTRIRKDMS